MFFLRFLGVILMLGPPKAIFGQEGLKVIEFEDNASREDSLYSQLFQLASGEYEFIISLEVDSYWQPKTRILALGLSTSKAWFRLEFERAKSNREVIQLSKKRICPKDYFALKELVNVQELGNLLSLDTDSLNLTRVQLSDTTINGEVFFREKALGLSDGTFHRFEIMTPTRHRIVPCYEPRAYLEAFPEIWQRKVFLNFLVAFLELWKTL